jgi:hypothetical protein
MIFCNVEGVQWLDDVRVVIASDKAKKDQPFRCVDHEQRVSIFALPEGSDAPEPSWGVNDKSNRASNKVDNMLQLQQVISNMQGQQASKENDEMEGAVTADSATWGTEQEVRFVKSFFEEDSNEHELVAVA